MIRSFLRTIILAEKSSSEKYISWLRKQGVKIGKEVTIFSPRKCLIDISCPWLLTIGDHVRIAHGVIILTHDYSWSVLRKLPENKGRILGAQSPVVIGNNVFIGMNAIITRGVTIGDNVVIGAGSIVTKNCESNSVYAGNPAKRIMSIEAYLKKRETAQFEEARKLVQAYYEHFGKIPPEEVLHEYFMLFCTADTAQQNPAFQRQLTVEHGLSDSIEYMQNHKPMFTCYHSFLEACFANETIEGSF